MGRPVSFDFTTGGGSPEEFLMGTVHLEPTLMHTIGNTVVLPDAPYPVKLVNGKAVHPNVAVSPAGPEPTWAYKVTIENELTGKAWSEFRGVPTGTTQIAYKDLTKFVTTIPPQTTAGMMQNWADTTAANAERSELAADRAEAPTDLMNKNLIEDTASLTNAALSAAIAEPKQAPTDGTMMALMQAGTKQTVALSGHSNFYGQGGDGTRPGINGQEGANTRSTNSPPEALKAALDIMWPGGFALANNTRSGENSRNLLGAYANPNLGWTHGNIEFVWLDSNDFVHGIPVEENAGNIRTLADEIIASGSQPVFLGGHFMKDRKATHDRQARANLVRRIADRYGTRYIDVAEIEAGFESVTNLWTDGVHFNDAGYAMVGTRLAALFGPKGLHPPAVGPGTRFLPNHQYIQGGTVTDRAGSEDGRTVKLTAGQTATIAFDVATPVDAVVRFYSNLTDGAGAGRIRYALGKAGIPDRGVSIAATGGGSHQPGVPVRGHTHRGGPDLIFVTCDTGTLEIEGIDFVPPAPNLRPSRPGANRTVTSKLGGVALSAPLAGNTYSMAADALTPVSGVKPDGSNADFRVDFLATFGAGTGASSQALALIAGVTYDQSWLGVGCGYAVRRAGGTAELVIRIFNADGTTSNHHVDGAYFTAGQAWSGTVSFVATAGQMQVLLNGVAVGATIPMGWKHFIPGAYAGAGPLLTIQGCTIQAPAGCV